MHKGKRERAGIGIEQRTGAGITARGEGRETDVYKQTGPRKKKIP